MRVSSLARLASIPKCKKILSYTNVIHYVTHVLYGKNTVIATDLLNYIKHFHIQSHQVIPQSHVLPKLL